MNCAVPSTRFFPKNLVEKGFEGKVPGNRCRVNQQGDSKRQDQLEVEVRGYTTTKQLEPDVRWNDSHQTSDKLSLSR